MIVCGICGAEYLQEVLVASPIQNPGVWSSPACNCARDLKLTTEGYADTLTKNREQARILEEQQEKINEMEAQFLELMGRDSL